jgi:hypothetical protein
MENKQQQIAEQIERILAKTDTCFGDCDNTKECSHTGHGCYLWKQYAKEIVEALDTGAKQREVLIHEHSLLYSLNEKKFQEIQFGGLGISDQQSFEQQVNAAIAMAWECVELRRKVEALSLQGNAPRWVKADPENETNLPALGFDVFVKFTDYEGGNHKGIGCLDNTIHGRRIKWGIGYGGCLLSNMVTLEWLDESPVEAEKSEGDLVASKSNTDDASLATLACTDGKAIQQIIESVKRGLWQFSLGTTGFEETTVFSDYVVRRSKEMLLLLNNGQGAQECDATMPNSNSQAE